MQSKRTGDELLKIVKIKYLKNKTRIIFDDASEIEVSNDVYVNHNFFVNKEIDKKEIKKLNKEEENIKHLNYAIKLVCSSNVSINEVENRLSKREVGVKETNDIIKYLLDSKLIDEEDNLNEKLEYYNYKNYGKNKIMTELYNKGFKKEDIDKLIFKDKNELKKANVHIIYLNKKYKSLPYIIKKNKAKEYLYQKGFDNEIIELAISNLDKEDKKLINEKLKSDYLKIKDKYKRKYKKEELNKKIIGYLLSKGYRYEDIKKLVKE